MTKLLLRTTVVALLWPVAASAHSVAEVGGGWLVGLSHPLGGFDHLLAMVAVGLWAVQLGGRALWALPLVFVTVMTLGAAVGMGGMPLPFIEAGILLSVLILGLLIAAALRLSLPASAAIVALFALFHGVAHGVEIPLAASAGAYSAGFVLATAMLHAAGVVAGLLLQHGRYVLLQRVSGGAIALGGLYLALA